MPVMTLHDVAGGCNCRLYGKHGLGFKSAYGTISRNLLESTSVDAYSRGNIVKDHKMYVGYAKEVEDC